MEVTARINRKRKTLVIEIPYHRPTVSGSGKTIVVATTKGCKTTTLQDSLGRPVVVNATAFVYPVKNTLKKPEPE